MVVAVGSGRRLLGWLQDGKLETTKQRQQLLEDEQSCPRGSGACREWGLSRGHWQGDPAS